MASLKTIASTIGKFFKDFNQPSVYRSGWTPSTPQVFNPQPAYAQEQPTPTPSPTPQPNVDIERLRQNIMKTWGPDTPVLNDLPLFVEAGNQLPAKADKTLPLILALRETQGGKDNRKPNSKTGKNNYFNIRGTQNGQSQFVNYPDIRTSLLGGMNNGDQSRGLVGLLNSPMYQDYQNSGNVQDLFSRWSPPTDNNGQLSEQQQNYEWIRSHLLQ